MKRLFNIVRWSLLGVVGALLLVELAWVASNWHDAQPQPRPAALALAAPQLPDEVNSFDAFVRLQDGLPKPRNVAILSCDALYENCASKWMKDVNALADARHAMAALGARCDELMGDSFEYEEKDPPVTGSAPMWDWPVHLTICADWWLSGGVLAWARGEKPAALASLWRADRLQRSLAAGSRSSSGLLTSQRIAQKTLRILTGIGLRDPGFGRTLLPMLAPLPDPVASVRRWIVYEAALKHKRASTISRSALWGEGESDSMPPEYALLGRAIAWHPNRASQLFDANRLRWLSQLDSGLINALHALKQEEAQAHVDRMGMLTWRDVTGSIIIALDDRSHMYFLGGQADLELHRELALHALTAQIEKVPATDRRNWVTSRPLSEFTKDRLQWDAQGRWVEATTWNPAWSLKHAPGAGPKIRIVWPSIVETSKH